MRKLTTFSEKNHFFQKGYTFRLCSSDLNGEEYKVLLKNLLSMHALDLYVKKPMRAKKKNVLFWDEKRFWLKPFSGSVSQSSAGLMVKMWILSYGPPRWPSGKASASRAEDPGFESRFRRDFSGVRSYEWLKQWHFSGYPTRRLAL